MTTPAQTVGPFFHGGLDWPDGPHVVPPGTPGSVTITGTVHDGAGEPVTDALVESWQADADGRFDHPDDPRGRVTSAFRGFGRCATDTRGEFRLLTVKPGALPTPDGRTEAPHIDLSIFARGLGHRLVTRVYFPDETDANAADPVLSTLPADRRATLVAVPVDDGLRFDIRLQGGHATVFFDV